MLALEWGHVDTDLLIEPVHIAPDALAAIIRDELRGLMRLGVDLPGEMIDAVAEAIVRRALAPQTSP